VVHIITTGLWGVKSWTSFGLGVKCSSFTILTLYSATFLSVDEPLRK
jgi:hypothetical protein